MCIEKISIEDFLASEGMCAVKCIGLKQTNTVIDVLKANNSFWFKNLDYISEYEKKSMVRVLTDFLKSKIDETKSVLLYSDGKCSFNGTLDKKNDKVYDFNEVLGLSTEYKELDNNSDDELNM